VSVRDFGIRLICGQSFFFHAYAKRRACRGDKGIYKKATAVQLSFYHDREFPDIHFSHTSKSIHDCHQTIMPGLRSQLLAELTSRDGLCEKRSYCTFSDLMLA
jgi:hypothetical protein